MNLVRNGTVVRNVTLSPFRDAEELERLLSNNIPENNDLGGMAVRRRSQSDDWSWSPHAFDVVYLTRTGASVQDVITLAVCSTGECSSYCDTGDTNVTRHDLVVSIRTIQEFSSPETFQVAFNTSSQPRKIKPLPINATNEMLRNKMTDLLGWECTEDEDIAERTLSYYTFENQPTDNSTSFCGAYSLRRPSIVRNGDQNKYRVDTVPYVSAHHNIACNTAST